MKKESKADITNTDNKGKVTIITAVAKKKADPVTNKGELMEANMDALEVGTVG